MWCNIIILHYNVLSDMKKQSWQIELKTGFETSKGYKGLTMKSGNKINV